MESKEEEAGPPRKVNGEVEFHYIKGQSHRVVHVDGAQGGISPTARNLVLSLFSERRAIPTLQIIPVQEGTLQAVPIRTEGKDGIVREIEMTAIMDWETVTALHEWMGKQIALHEAIERESQK